MQAVQNHVDLTVMDLDGPLPPAGHAIYDFPNPQDYKAPEMRDLPLEFAKLQLAFLDITTQFAAFRKDILSRVQKLQQEFQMNKSRSEPNDGSYRNSTGN